MEKILSTLTKEEYDLYEYYLANKTMRDMFLLGYNIGSKNAIKELQEKLFPKK